MNDIRIIGRIDLPESPLRNRGLMYNKCDHCGDLIHPSIMLDNIRVFKPKEGIWYDKYVCSVCSYLYYK